jgi:hypothetical protein
MADLREALAVVDLRDDCEQVKKIWRSCADVHVPLSLAAALAFHEAHGSATVVPQREYEDGLNLAAAALSRLVTIYAIDERTRTPVSARCDLGTGRFRHGASTYEHADGTTMTPLVVPRDHLATAVELIRSTGIPFQLAGVYSA